MSIKIEDLKKITLNDNLVESLTYHNGVIPKALILFIDSIKYTDNLKKLGTYDEVMEEYYQIRVARKKSDDKNKFDIDEFDNWLKHNSKFEEIILSSLNQ